MKVYINSYRDNWISPYHVLEKVLFWKDWDNIDYDTPWVDKWSNRLEPWCVRLQKLLNVVNPKINYVKIDRWDAWSMDHTLAYIILPLLKRLQLDKQGAPFIDDEDVPMNLWSTSCAPKVNDYDTDDNHFKRWEWVLNEMIWSFTQKLEDDSESQFYDHSQVDLKAPLNVQIGAIKCDYEGLKAFNQRKANGFRLFGKYYEALWD